MMIYMCGIAWECELGNTDVKVYASEEDLKEDHDCWEECGIVEVSISGNEVRYLYPGKLG